MSSIIDKLIRRDRPESLSSGRVTLLDVRGRRAEVQAQGALVWCSYDPGDLVLAVGSEVIVGRVGGALQVLTATQSVLPTETLMEL